MDSRFFYEIGSTAFVRILIIINGRKRFFMGMSVDAVGRNIKVKIIFDDVRQI